MESTKLDDTSWQFVPGLGPDWLGKWDFSLSGYEIILTDGCEFWEEKRDSSYISKKAEIWAECLDEVERLGSLIADQLSSKSSTITITEKTTEKFDLHLESSIENLPFQWQFELLPVPNSKTRQCWLRPIAATLEYYSYKVEKLEEELRKRERQLEEFQPSVSRRKEDRISQYAMDASISNMKKTSSSVVLSRHLKNNSEFVKKVKMMEKVDNIPDGQVSSSTVYVSSIRNKIRKGVDYDSESLPSDQTKTVSEGEPVKNVKQIEPKSEDDKRKKKKRKIIF